MKKPLPESWILKLFSKFQVIYGHKWLSIVDTGDLLELAIIEWSERLAGLTGEQIKHGLDNLKDEWVPTPMSFRTLCTGNDGTHNTAAYRVLKSPLEIGMSDELKKIEADKRRAKLKAIREEANI